MTDDEATRSELKKRIEKLEREVYPSRRDMLKAGAGAAVGGAAVFGATGSASAGTASSGEVGTQSNPVDAYLEDLYDHNGNQPLSLPGDGSVSIGNLTFAGRTVDSILEGETTGLREEHGTDSSGSVAGSSDGTWDTRNTVQNGISFGTAFSSTPTVIACPVGTALFAEPTNESTTGFDMNHYNYTSSSGSGDANWIAVGPE